MKLYVLASKASEEEMVKRLPVCVHLKRSNALMMLSWFRAHDLCCGINITHKRQTSQGLQGLAAFIHKYQQ